MIQKNRSNSNPIIGIIGLVLFLVAVYLLIKGITWILGLIAPVLLILTLFMDHTVVTDYLKWIADLFKKKWYYGLAAAGITFFAHPFVSAFLFGKAMLKKKFGSSMGGALGGALGGEPKEDFTDFEEVESEIVLDDVDLQTENLDLPEIEENLNTLDEDNAYENLFDNDK